MELVAINLHRRLLNSSNEISHDDDSYRASNVVVIALAVVGIPMCLAIVINILCILSISRAARAAAAAEARAARARAAATRAAATAEAVVAPGLQKDEFMRTVYKSGRDVTDDNECSICLGDFVNGETIRVLPECGHRFHVGCIDTWLVLQASCPNCRIYLPQRP